MVLYNRTRVSRVPNRIVIGMETISASELKSGWSRLRIDDKRIIWRHEQSDYSILLFISKWTIFTFLLRNMVWYMLTFIWDWIKYGLKFDYFKLLRVWFYMQSAVDALKHRTLCKNLMCQYFQATIGISKDILIWNMLKSKKCLITIFNKQSKWVDGSIQPVVIDSG